MIERVVAPDVRLSLSYQAAVAIVGPRQVGKTTLAKEIAGERPGSLYLDLEDSEDRVKLLDPKLILSEYRNTLVVLDEIQRVPDLFSSLRGITHAVGD